MAALGWLLNLGFAGGGVVIEREPVVFFGVFCSGAAVVAPLNTGIGCSAQMDSVFTEQATINSGAANCGRFDSGFSDTTELEGERLT